ncbi:hypothetical protein [Futiania mangrovi]|uniref:Secreted protein n=1 Tax=Futiania mangrovi TaxID=2959716 RepID=A0A9J6PAZ1_9PROT|nr:hypothetical protein [Futiania mangrovii]MCP1335278.1 hypothetical protein [Futiania mangrovii]
MGQHGFIVSAMLAGLAAAGAAMPAHADPVDAILAAARSDCAAFENGVFHANDAVVEADLDGAAPADRLVDSSRFTCTSARSLYCGSGGCTLHAVIGERSWSFQAEGWRTIAWGERPILLVARDGGWCGGAGSQLCFEAVVWSHGEMLTVMPPARR